MSPWQGLSHTCTRCALGRCSWLVCGLVYGLPDLACAPKGSRIRKTRDWIPAVMPPSCVTLERLLGLSGLRFPCGRNGINASTHLIGCQEDETKSTGRMFIIVPGT